MDATRFARLLRVGWMLPVLSVLLCVSAAADATDLFEEYGDGGRYFEEIEISHMLVYFHQRMIGAATVEKDYIVYQLDKDTGELLARKSHWRDDLPAVLPGARVSREQAEALVAGEIQFSDFFIISPESDVFPLNPTPENPCWAVRSVDVQGQYVVTIIDAASGVILGKGVPPPYTAFSLTGPWYFDPCDGSWSSWSQNAEWWFNAMGYSTEEVVWPTEVKIQSHIQSTETAMFYELAHGGSTYFASGCVGGNDAEYTYASEIEAWMVGYEKMPFAFIGSCAGMCSSGDGTFAYEFRKGSPDNTTVVGYCGMSESQCSTCWTYSIDWQDTLFYYMSLGYAVNDAYDQANADYPACASGDCMRFAGDEDFAVVPLVPRIPGLEFDYPNGLPELVSPAGGTTVRVEVSSGGGFTPQPGTGQFHYDIGDGFVTVDMQEVSENVYDAVFPADDCGDEVLYYVSAEAVGGEVFTDPRNAPDSVYSASAAYGVIVFFEDDFETDQGWSVSGNAATGHWERGVPVGGGDRGDPPTDYDGSGKCYVTENVDGDSDVDDGYTYLDSPTIDLSAGDAQIGYALWYTNNFGNDPNNDLFKTYVSNDDGANWVLAETIGPVTSGGWAEHSFWVGDFVTPTDQVRVRFEVSDLNEGSVVEAGIDAFRATTFDCESPCVGDLDGDGDTDQADLGILLASYGNDAGGDLDGDGDTDQADLGILLADWGCGT